MAPSVLVPAAAAHRGGCTAQAEVVCRRQGVGRRCSPFAAARHGTRGANMASRLASIEQWDGEVDVIVVGSGISPVVRRRSRRNDRDPKADILMIEKAMRAARRQQPGLGPVAADLEERRGTGRVPAAMSTANPIPRTCCAPAEQMVTPEPYIEAGEGSRARWHPRRRLSEAVVLEFPSSARRPRSSTPRPSCRCRAASGWRSTGAWRCGRGSAASSSARWSTWCRTRTRSRCSA